MNFSTKECAWSNVSITFLGRRITGLRGFEIKKSLEKEAMYGEGSDPLDIQTGNRKNDGNLKVLKFEIDMFNDAAVAAGYADILEVPHEAIAITCLYRKISTDPIRSISVLGVAFTELGAAMEQGAKYTEVTLPYIAIKTVFAAKAS